MARPARAAAPPARAAAPAPARGPARARPPVLDRRPRLRPRLPRPPHRGGAARRRPTRSASSSPGSSAGRSTGSRPLWESYVIEGLPDDRFAILTKVHHATVDGASGVELLTLMLDADPAGDELAPADERVDARPRAVGRRDDPARPRRAGPQAGPGRAAQRPHRPRARPSDPQPGARRRGQPGAQRSARTARRRAQHRSRRGTRASRRSARCPSLSPPRTPFNAPITPHRRFAFRSVPLQTIKDIKSALGATVNDVVMAVCAGGLRTWLDDHDALPDEPLVAMIPVSVRTGEEAERWTNRVSAHLRVAAGRRARPARAGPPGPRGDGRRQAALRRRPGRVAHRLHPVPAAGRVRAGDAHRHPADRPLRHAGQPGDLQRARAPRAALRGRRQAPALLPGLHDRRRPGPQRHRAELPRHPRLRPRRPAASSSRTCGTWSTPWSTRSMCSPTPAASPDAPCVSPGRTAGTRRTACTGRRTPASTSGRSRSRSDASPRATRP